jgi:hypothetical protein
MLPIAQTTQRHMVRTGTRYWRKRSCKAAKVFLPSVFFHNVFHLFTLLNVHMLLLVPEYFQCSEHDTLWMRVYHVPFPK